MGGGLWRRVSHFRSVQEGEMARASRGASSHWAQSCAKTLRWGRVTENKAGQEGFSSWWPGVEVTVAGAG